MRRPLAAALVGLAVLLPTVAAHAGEETPQGRFSSPTRAVAGAPIWVRSVTPCPVTPGAYQFVRVGISPQGVPSSLAYVESTDADLAADGSWTVTLSAPSDMANGVTKSYDIQAQCLENEAPYAAPDRDPSVTTTTLNPEFSYHRYFLRRLYVTGFGSADATGSGASSDDDDAPTPTTTTTSTTAPTTSTTSGFSLQSAGLDGHDDPTTTTWVSDEAERAAEARAELARLTKSADDDVTLSASPVVSTTPRPAEHAGIPWWSFVLATMLAVGTVVGFGQRRRSAA